MRQTTHITIHFGKEKLTAYLNVVEGMKKYGIPDNEAKLIVLKEIMKHSDVVIHLGEEIK